MEKEVFTIRSLASLLEMSEQTAYKLAREGAIPGRIKVGRSVRFNKKIVLDWLQQGGAKDDSQN
ncbi:helix-turn-helix domain-containing protein [Lysinibacillus pakistanensis]|uniref:helix-turn-helix transcriptional regulator n=1 Tax=Lysinibacillus pakistanensis TaxID=759811 RepID=UPI003D26744C